MPIFALTGVMVTLGFVSLFIIVCWCVAQIASAFLSIISVMLALVLRASSSSI